MSFGGRMLLGMSPSSQYGKQSTSTSSFLGKVSSYLSTYSDSKEDLSKSWKKISPFSITQVVI
jgi:hypothetical protein